MLNRGGLIVRPKQPYLEWAAALDDSGILPDVSGEQTVYLVPGFETDEEAEEVLEAVYSEVFEREHRASLRRRGPMCRRTCR